MSDVLGARPARAARGVADAGGAAPTLFIPLFFLVVNIGQAARIFPSAETAFLYGQSYAAFQLPVSLLLAGSFGTRRAVPRRGDRGRLLRQAARDAGLALGDRARAGSIAEFVKGVLIATAMVLLAWPSASPSRAACSASSCSSC